MEPPKANMTPKVFDFKLKEKDIIFTITFSEENEKILQKKKKNMVMIFQKKVNRKIFHLLLLVKVVT